MKPSRYSLALSIVFSGATVLQARNDVIPPPPPPPRSQMTTANKQAVPKAGETTSMLAKKTPPPPPPPSRTIPAKKEESLLSTSDSRVVDKEKEQRDLKGGEIKRESNGSAVLSEGKPESRNSSVDEKQKSAAPHRPPLPPPPPRSKAPELKQVSSKDDRSSTSRADTMNMLKALQDELKLEGVKKAESVAPPEEPESKDSAESDKAAMSRRPPLPPPPPRTRVAKTAGSQQEASKSDRLTGADRPTHMQESETRSIRPPPPPVKQPRQTEPDTTTGMPIRPPLQKPPPPRQAKGTAPHAPPPPQSLERRTEHKDPRQSLQPPLAASYQQQQQQQQPYGQYRQPPFDPRMQRQQPPMDPRIMQSQRPPMDPRMQQRMDPSYRPGMNAPPPQRMTPQQMHQQYYSRRVQAKPPPAWKRMWKNIERGLDGLSDLEENLTGAAQKLYSSTVDTVSSTVGSVSSTVGSTVSSTVKIPVWKRDSSGKEEAEPSTSATWTTPPKREPASMNAQKASKVVEEETKAEEETDKKESVPTNPYLMFQKSFPAKEETKRQQAPSSSMQVRKINWNNIRSGRTPTRVIRANGGASVPQDAQRQDASGSSQARPEQSPNGQRPTEQRPPERTGPASLTSSPGAPSGQPRAFAEQSKSAVVEKTPQPPPRRYPDEEDDESASFLSKLGRFLPPIPRVGSMLRLLGRGSSMRDYSSAMDVWELEDDDDVKESKGFLGLFRRKEPSFSDDALVSSRGSAQQLKSDALTPPLSDLMERCNRGKTTSILAAEDKKKCVSLGRHRATLDVLTLALILVGARLLPDFRDIPWQHSVEETIKTSIPAVLHIIADAMDGWAPFAFAAAFLAAQTNALLNRNGMESLAQSVGAAVGEEARYGALFLRLFSSASTSRDLPERVQGAAREETVAKVETVRLRTFAACIMATLVLMTASMIRPLVLALVQALAQFVGLKQWRQWPPRWNELGTGLKDVFVPLGQTISSIFGDEVIEILDRPLLVAYETSVFAAMVAVSFLPTLERIGKVQAVSDQDDEDEESIESHVRFTEHISSMAASGANRLELLSDNTAIDSVLERWRIAVPQVPQVKNGISLRPLFRLCVYGILAGAILAAPLAVYGYVGITPFGSSSNPFIRWDSLYDVAIVLLFTHGIVWNALKHAVQSAEAKKWIAGFLPSLAEAIEERSRLMQTSSANLQVQASISPSAGLLVKDLWAAHTTKRAWAVRGANVACRNGEILVLLGDDGAGKTRLLTTLAEAILNPPKLSLSASRVRGTISVGNLDVTKWDKNMLKKRVGLLLNDVRTVSDTAQLWTGLTLEEILEPLDGLRTLDPAHNPGASERACMILALKMTGLYTSLLPRLPSKLSTVISANEEDLKPSPLRPRYNVLSPTEWSKLLLARVLAQAVYDNENSAGSNDKVESSLIGSLLLLDDATGHLSEGDEARILRDLRKTGAATVLTSNRWATGRFADRIAVVKDGAIVESGTHSELLNRGPQQSLYAAKWHAMTTASQS